MGPFGASGPTASVGASDPCRGLSRAENRLEDRPSMDRTNAGERAFATAHAIEPEAIDFVRFCPRRRRVGRPEPYAETCAAAGRSLYRGYGAEQLAALGIAAGAFDMPGSGA